jgi:hypothetical protein
MYREVEKYKKEEGAANTCACVSIIRVYPRSKIGRRGYVSYCRDAAIASGVLLCKTPCRDSILSAGSAWYGQLKPHSGLTRGRYGRKSACSGFTSGVLLRKTPSLGYAAMKWPGGVTGAAAPEEGAVEATRSGAGTRGRQQCCRDFPLLMATLYGRDKLKNCRMAAPYPVYASNIELFFDTCRNFSITLE